uniref:Uncharacterized protein n=1 Tax=Arundo donax TaxID=35708 RepID=A0A0A9ANJ2_ARUDO
MAGRPRATHMHTFASVLATAPSAGRLRSDKKASDRASHSILMLVSLPLLSSTVSMHSAT